MFIFEGDSIIIDPDCMETNKPQYFDLFGQECIAIKRQDGCIDFYAVETFIPDSATLENIHWSSNWRHCHAEGI